MQRVTGIGGVFFGSKDSAVLRARYQRHLRIDVQPRGRAAFSRADGSGAPAQGTTNWSVADAADTPFAPGTSPFMVNCRVADLHALLRVLRDESWEVLDRTEDSEFGCFAWVMDPEGNKVERRQPPAGRQQRPQCGTGIGVSRLNGVGHPAGGPVCHVLAWERSVAMKGERPQRPASRQRRTERHFGRADIEAAPTTKETEAASGRSRSALAGSPAALAGRAGRGRPAVEREARSGCFTSRGLPARQKVAEGNGSRTRPAAHGATHRV